MPNLHINVMKGGHYVSSVLSKDKTTQLRRVQHYEFDLFIGKQPGSCFINDKQIPSLDRGAIIFTKPGQIRRDIFPYECYYFYFKTDNPLICERLENIPTFLKTEYPELFLKKIKSIIKISAYNSTLENGLLLQEKGYDLIYHIISHFGNTVYTVPEKNSNTLSEAKRYIEKNFASDLSLESLAKYFNFSPTYFHKMFTRYNGITPARYITQTRITNAKYLIALDELPLQSIATKCGFSSASYFCEKFRQETGMSPSQYKEKILVSNKLF